MFRSELISALYISMDVFSSKGSMGCERIKLNDCKVFVLCPQKIRSKSVSKFMILWCLLVMVSGRTSSPWPQAPLEPRGLRWKNRPKLKKAGPEMAPPTADMEDMEEPMLREEAWRR